MFRMHRVTSPIRRNDRLRLLLEHLEDRTVPATIHGTAFYDTLIANGIRDSGEPPAPGVQVRLVNTPTTVTTDANGWYAFVGPLMGSYPIAFTPVPGYVIGTPAGGSTYVSVGPVDVTVNAGLVAEQGGSESWSLEADTDTILKEEAVTFWVWTDADPWPSISSYEWDFDYDGTFEPDAAAGTDWYATTTFATAGGFTIAARLTDDGANTEIVSESVSVENPPPDVTMPADMTAVAGTPTTLTVQATAESGIASVEWWFSEDGEDYYLDPTVTGLTPTTVFETAGEYDAWFEVFDNAGKSADGWFHLSVADAPPVEQITLTKLGGEPVGSGIDEGTTVTFTVNDLSVDLDTTTVYVDWLGDGVFDQLNQSGVDFTFDPSNPDIVSFNHLYDDNSGAQPFQPKVRLQDEWGLFDLQAPDLMVHNVAPTATVTAGIQFATQTFSNQDVWGISPGQNLEMIAFDPSKADTAELVNHWKISEQSLNGTFTEVLSLPNGPNPRGLASLPLPSYQAGKIYEVEAYVTDKNNGESPKTKFKVVVDGNGYDGWAGTHWLPGKIYGTFSIVEGVDNGKIKPPTVYNRYAQDLFITPPVDPDLPTVANVSWGLDGGTWKTITVHFELDADSQSLLTAHPDWTVDYRFAMAVYDVEQFTIWSDNHDLLNNESDFKHGQSSQTFNVYSEDREIHIIAAADFLDASGQVVRTTSAADFVRNAGSNYGLVDVMHQPRAVLITPKTLTTWQQVTDTWAAVRELAQQFEDRAQKLLDAIATESARARTYEILTQGFAGAIDLFGQNLPLTVRQNLASWLGGGVGMDVSKFANMSSTEWLNTDNWGNFLLEYAGLTWDNVYKVVQQQLGAGNLAAIEKAAAWFENNATSSPGAFRELLTRLADDGSGLDPAVLAGRLIDKVLEQIPQAVAKAGAQLAAKFVPGAGMAISLYNGLTWVLNNRTQLASLFQQFLGVIDDLVDPNYDTTQAITEVKAKLVAGFNGLIGVSLPLLAGQLGLGSLPQQMKKALSFVPMEVEKALRKAVDAVASRVLPALPGVQGGTKPGKMFDGLLAPPREFQYPETNGKTYILWVAQDKIQVQVFVAEKVNGAYKFIGALTASSFVGTQAAMNMSALITKARELHTLSKNPTPPGTNPLPALKAKQELVATAEDLVVADIRANACKVINAGCFAAGTKLLTRSGWRAVETIQPGEEVLSRPESDPAGEPAWKVVEARFERTGCILHLHVEGEVIRTTPEHPFFVEGEGWKAAGSLSAGDRIATLSGEWVQVEEVFDTQEWAPVYNLRVADYHTYFVGDEGWGFAAWAHNEYTWTQTSSFPATGSYNTVSDSSGYSRPWWRPTNFAPLTRLQSDPCKDKSTELGDRLKASAQAFADGWTNKTKSERYGTRLDKLQAYLDTINGFLPTAQQLTLDQIDQQAMRFPTLSSPSTQYNNAVSFFWFQRSVCVGCYVHTKLKGAFENEPGLAYNSGARPDFNYTYTTPEGPRTIYFEVLPDTATAREAHASRGMKTYLYRCVYYNRTAINNGGSSEEKVEIPSEF